MNLKNVISLLYQAFKRVFKGLLSLIYKETCVNCGITLDAEGFQSCAKNEIPLCKTCLKSVEILSPFAHSKIQGVEIFSACFYEGVIREIIHKLKFRHNLAASKVLGYILYSFYLKIIKTECPLKNAAKNPKNLIVIPIPTNKKNVLTRGYNNVLKISEEFASLAGLGVKTDILIKIKDTRPQFELSKKARAANVKGCFGVNLKNYKGGNILLIDDIITTGSTLSEAISTLKNSGVKNIFCLTVSKKI